MIYTTTQTHSLGAKAALILGLCCRPLTVTPEDNFSLRGSTVASAIHEDVESGLAPFIIGLFICSSFFLLCG